MELKTATALAIFGSVLMCLAQLFFTINSFLKAYSIDVFGILIPAYVSNIMFLLGYVFLLVFFSTLYSRQNREE